MSQYRFEIATPADDADLRHILKETPMAGEISVSFCREPSYFDASVVTGRFRQVVAARQSETGRLVGFGARAISNRYVNGRPVPIGYLSSLRLLAPHRNRGLVARGYAFFRRLHEDQRTCLYLTTIAEGNDTALAILTSGRVGLPAYHFAGRYHTVAIPISPRVGRTQTLRGIEIRSAQEGDISAILAFLASAGPARQFFPCYEPDDFFTPGGTFRDLEANDLLLAFRSGRLVGMLGAWDQQGFQQTVVHGYTSRLRWARPFYNGWARIANHPRLPAPGECFRHLTAVVPTVADNDREVFAAMLQALLSKCSRNAESYLLVGLNENDPLLDVLRTYRATWYTTRLYLVCWSDGDPIRETLDGRPPYLELGCL
jgi:hypothetical protein